MQGTIVKACCIVLGCDIEFVGKCKKSLVSLTKRILRCELEDFELVRCCGFIVIILLSFFFLLSAGAIATLNCCQ